MIKRDTLMDSIKFILMFLVVYGHVMQEHIEGCNLNASIYTFIYTFHMPLFVLISGYFTNTNKNTGEYFKKIFQFLVVYLLFATIRGIIKGELSLVFLIRPGGTLWYLVSLIWFRIFIWFFRRYNIYTLLTVSFLAALIGGYVGTDILAFQRTVNFLPYFLIGYMIRQNGYTLNHLSSVSGGGKIVAFILLVIIFSLSIKYNDENVRDCLYGWKWYNDEYTLIRRAATYVVAIVSVGSVICLIPDLKEKSRIGSDTLFIYMIHNYLTTPISRMFIKYNLPDNFLVLLVIAGVIFVVVCIISKIKLLHILVEPVDITLKWCKTYNIRLWRH